MKAQKKQASKHKLKIVFPYKVSKSSTSITNCKSLYQWQTSTNITYQNLKKL